MQTINKIDYKQNMILKQTVNTNIGDNTLLKQHQNKQTQNTHTQLIQI